MMSVNQVRSIVVLVDADKITSDKRLARDIVNKVGIITGEI